ncbi:hypothetical protein SAMN04488505_102924 [Chitinophaga rupis]|uniref:Collagen triple helix repeat-containing protein n=1 Tax=Chitinophaga rupis TaxID=573321 RepID=A0A1H7SFM5_9BACT|nr:hypothetical protein [Chitinophaga rupis]SEL71511.1 hypothetical protein SAMN04488505_102924 [Chitinophaga rupis]
MKRVTTHIASLMLLAVSLLYVACTKEGPAGPQGEQGPPGANGANGGAGPAGPQGEKGDTGTANVIYSDWLDVVFEADTFRNAGVLDTAGFFSGIDAPKLDQTILTTGEMKVYVNLGTAADPNVVPLPYYDVYFNANINVNFVTGGIGLYSNFDPGTGIDSDSGEKIRQYRYILIPGGANARKAKNINWNNYKEVKAYLKLKD